MKKKVLIIALTSFLALGASTAVVLFSKGKTKEFKASDSYTISFHAKDVTNEDSDWDSGELHLATDQLKNSITFTYENVQKSGDGAYLQGNGYGKIYNTIGNEVRGMESIFIVSDTSNILVRWGFKEGSTIKYVDHSTAYVDGDGYAFDLNGNHPNYFSIESGGMADSYIKEVVITYPSDCVETENPYKTVDGIKYYKTSGNEYYVTGFDDASFANVTIPAEIDGLPVTEILGGAFYTNDVIESISLPNTIKAIGNNAFRECDNLTTVTFATGGTENLSIYDCAFRETGITSLTLPKRLDYIDADYALYGTNDLESIQIEDNYSEGNYKCLDGVLYRVDQYLGLEVIHYPASSPYPVYNIPNNVYKIHQYSCEDTVNLETIFFNNADPLFIDAYAFGNGNDNSSIQNIYFQGSGQVTLYWNCFRGFKGDLVLHEDTIIDARGLGQMAGNARVFFQASEVQTSWDSDWAEAKNITYGANVTFYLYSETAPVDAAPANIDGFWHYVSETPTLW